MYNVSFRLRIRPFQDIKPSPFIAHSDVRMMPPLLPAKETPMVDKYRAPLAALVFAMLLTACGQGGQAPARAGGMPSVSVVTVEPQNLTLST